MVSLPLELVNHRRLLLRMTLRDFKARYAGSLMGLFWTVITPLALLGVFTFLFTLVFKARFGNHPGIGQSAIFILSGLIPWLAFQDGLTRAGVAPLENKNLATRARFPLSLLPACPTISAFLGQLAGFIILVVLAAVYVAPPGPSLLLLPLIMALQLVFTIGLGLAYAAIAVYVRDLIHALPVVLLVWFYATPVFYPTDLAPEKLRPLFDLNPMAVLIECYRAVILEAQWPSPRLLGAATGFAALALIAGAAVHARLAPGFADRL